MTPPKQDAGYVRMPEDEFEAMLARAAEKGARRALADVGLDGPEAAIDIRDLRTLLDSLRMARRTGNWRLHISNRDRRSGSKQAAAITRGPHTATHAKLKQSRHDKTRGNDWPECANAIQYKEKLYFD